MRKAEREIKEYEDVLALLDECQTIRLGLTDEKYPYVVPLSFGWEATDKLYIYFHRAREGKKARLIDRNNAVCVEADVLKGYVSTEHSVTADYKSVIGFGHAQLVSGEEAIHGLELLLRHCGANENLARGCVFGKAVAVYKITIDEITGKKRF